MVLIKMEKSSFEFEKLRCKQGFWIKEGRKNIIYKIKEINIFKIYEYEQEKIEWGYYEVREGQRWVDMINIL